jgi:hypothetical protein
MYENDAFGGTFGSTPSVDTTTNGSGNGHGAQAGSWQPDPWGRYQLRYWDASGWTSHVATNGQQAEDPVSGSPPAFTATATPMAAPASAPMPMPYQPQPYGYSTSMYMRQTTNGMAVASLVLGILWMYWLGSILALVFGYIAKRQIDQSNGQQTGRGMAVAGIVLGWIGVAILSVIIVAGLIAAGTSNNNY